MHSYITREKGRTVLNKKTHTHTQIYTKENTHTWMKKKRNKLKHSVYFKLLTFEI